jgi:rubrerythrin
MSNHIPLVDVTHLHEFDTDGAVREAADNVERAVSRRGLIRNTGFVAAGGVAAAVMPGSALAASFGPVDRSILNFALTLEYLEFAFYKRALENMPLTGELKRFATVVAAHEKAHVVALRKTLGSAAVKRPSFNFGSATRNTSTFIATAIALEDTGVEAYSGQATRLRSDKLVAAAASILPIEARHAAWIRYIAGQNPAPASFNPSKTKDQVLSVVASTGFING